MSMGSLRIQKFQNSNISLTLFPLLFLTSELFWWKIVFDQSHMKKQTTLKKLVVTNINSEAILYSSF